ncbi:uncharacterized protein LOC144714960 [Wolffia australiana]
MREHESGDCLAVPDESNLNLGGTEEKSCDPECRIEISNIASGVIGSSDGENQKTSSISDPDCGNNFAMPPETGLKKDLVRSRSYHDLCRVCQDLSDEPLIELGCKCRGELSKAHKSCMETWFESRGSNKCEICQQIAVNVPPPKSWPGKNYTVWRVDQVHHGSEVRLSSENERRGACPVCFALCILIGGLLLDVFVSLSLGVSALPVNIMIGALILLSLGTALRIGMRCHSEGTLRIFSRRRALTVESTPPA